MRCGPVPGDAACDLAKGPDKATRPDTGSSDIRLDLFRKP